MVINCQRLLSWQKKDIENQLKDACVESYLDKAIVVTAYFINCIIIKSYGNTFSKIP